MIKLFLCESRENPICPYCNSALKYRDSRKRIMRWYNSGVRYIIVRRMKCTSCNKLHAELPDCLAPYKQYAAEIIENEIDGIVSEDDLCTEDRPCSKTVDRWNQWLLNLNPKVLRSLFSILKSLINNFKISYTPEEILLSIRKFGAGWMTLVSVAGIISREHNRNEKGSAPELSGARDI
ncbi:DUF6431 domain-containing protein [Oribacterium sp. FC2011]|uniref:DUF6431 domain-containing protein n=1 Tax=Oribacterium sp. FC2011 TaxID=1408311 RepID=UPI00210136CA|nr:DUF6431 domain-containing protein [Oribacterium sp. FC2011]